MRSAEFIQPLEFSEVPVVPIEAVLDGPILGSQFRGGPIWPDFRRQVLARHCEGAVARPVDDPPLQKGDDARKVFPRAVWCGPIVGHFGHAIADFGTRIAASAHLASEGHFLFSGRPPTWTGVRHPPPFFYEILDLLRMPRERVRIVREPVLARSLSVYPQAERRPDGGPSEAYLDLLQAISVPVRPAGGKDIDTLYVSRSASVVGGLAGEGYLDTVFAQLGVTVFRPETRPLREQLETYGRAARIVFCEGSAIHALQLLGRLDAEVVVICRRPGSSLAKASLLPRCRSLTYVDALAELVFGLRPSGWPQTPKGMGVLNERRFLEQMDHAGLNLRRCWSSIDYQSRRDDDLARWRAGRPQPPDRHPLEPLVVEHLVRRAQRRAH